MFKRFCLGLKTAFLMTIPVGIYIWYLKKHCKLRMKNIMANDLGVTVGENPVAYMIYHDTIIIDLTQMQI